MNFPEVESGGNGKDLLKMKGGDTVTGIFRGDPHIFRQHWDGGRSYLCQGKDQCDFCKNGDKPKFRFAINFLVKEGNGYVAKIFEQSYGTYLDLKALHESGYKLESTVVQIKRVGDDKNTTRYSLIPSPKQPGDLKKLDEVPLHNLSNKETNAASAGGETLAGEDDIPF